MKKCRWLAILIGVAISGSAMAANWDWDGGGGADTSWATVENWKNDAFYSAGDVPIFRPGDFATVPLGVNFDLASSPLRIGQDGVGSTEVQILGGDLTIKHNAFIGFKGIDCLGILTVSNGSFTVGIRPDGVPMDLTMSWNNSSGTLNMYGGAVNVARTLRLGAGAGTSTIGLFDGKFTVGALNPMAGANIAMSIEKGLWEINTLALSNVNAMILAGQITGDGSNGGADVSAYNFVTNSSAGDLHWGVSIIGTDTNTVVYTVGTASSANLSLDPSTQLVLTLDAPATTTSGAVDASFTYGAGSNNVEITGVSFTGAHAASFSSTDTFPISLTDPAVAQSLGIQFDNSVAGLVHQETASATLSITWNEIGSASQTKTLPVQASYNNAPATLNLNPSDILRFVTTTAAAETKQLALSYTGATVDPTNVVIASVSYTNQLKIGSFSVLTSLPLTLTSGDALDIQFDAVAGALAVNEMAATDLIVTWYELGHTVTNETLFPLVGSYLAPATGVIEDHGTTMPSGSQIVFESGANKGASVPVTRNFRTLGGVNPYTKVYQEIKGTEPKLAGVTTFDGLVLQMRRAADFTGLTSGANQLQIWFGKINTTSSNVVATLQTDTFDCSDQVFDIHGFYQFKLSSAVNFDPANLGADEAYGFEIWWTADDADNKLEFWRGNGGSYIEGGANHTTGNIAVNPGFPIDMSNPVDDKDMVFALASGLSLVNSVNDVSVGLDGSGNLVASFIGEAGGTYAMQRTDDLVYGTWVDVQTGLTGEGAINVTIDTTEAQSFYRIILQ